MRRPPASISFPAAGELFARDGFAATTMRAIAQEAGVSVESVYLTGSKPSLLLAAFEQLFAGDEGSHSLTERPAIAEIMAMPDTAAAIDHYVDFVAEANGRAIGLWRAMRSAADQDGQVARRC